MYPGTAQSFWYPLLSREWVSYGLQIWPVLSPGALHGHAAVGNCARSWIARLYCN